MARNRFPQRVRQMIHNAYHRGEDAATAASRINKSATAARHGLNYTTREIAAAIGWCKIKSTTDS